MVLGKSVLLLLLLISSIDTDPLEKSYQTGLLAFAEWDLNHDCIVTYDEFKSWVLDMLMTVIKYQALVEAAEPSTKDYAEATYESMMRRVFENLGMLSYQNANVTQIINHYITRLAEKLNDPKIYETDKIERIFKFKARHNLTFWYNL